jgi:hypothetical protein
MAEWRKVIVSGSTAQLATLQVGSNQQIGTTQATTFLTGSFTGSFIGSGAGLTGVTATASFPTTAKTDLATTDKFFVNDDAGDATSGNKKITYGSLVTDLAGSGAGSSNLTTTDTGDSLALTSQITVTGVTASLFGNASTVTTNANLTGNVTSVGNSTTIAPGVVTSAMITDDTIVNADINSAAGIVYTKLNLGSSTIHSGSFFNGITVVSGSSQITYSGLTGVPAGIVSGSSQVLNGSGVFSGSAQLPANIVSSSAQTIAHLPAGTVSGSSQILAGTTIHSGSFFNGITVVSGSAQILAGSSIVSASILSSPLQGQVALSTNGVGQSAINIAGLTSGATPTFTGIGTTGNITTTNSSISIFPANATTVTVGAAATALSLGATTGTTTVNNNLSVLGTLYVQGSVTAISSSNLYVADQFILLASGSVGDTDGGIIIDRGTYAAGNIAFGYDAGQDRWGYQNGLVDTTNAIDTTSASGVSGSFAVYSFTELAHTSTKPTTGEFVQAGAIYTNTDGTIWMYA